MRCLHLLSVPSSYFWQAWSPLAPGHAIITSRSPGLPGAHLCLAAPVHSRSPDALACIQGPITPVHDLRYAWRKTLKAPHALPRPSPAQPSPAQICICICICRFSSEKTLGSPSSEPLAVCADSPWQAKQHVTQCHADGFQHQCLLLLLAGQAQTSWMPQCRMASRRTTSSTVASMFRETFQPSMGQTSDAALRQPPSSAASPKHVDNKGQQIRLLGSDRVFLVQESPPGGTVVHCSVSHCSVRPAVNTRHFSRCTSTGLGKVIKAIGIACALPCAPGRAMRRRTPPALRPSTSLSAPSR